MELVFSTDQYDRSRRYAAWRDAICDVYVHVDVEATDPSNYQGFIREAQFGDVAVTDILLSEQTIRRRPHHISRLDKDCYYLQLIHQGYLDVVQGGKIHRSNAARGALFCATEQYELYCNSAVRSLYLEIPRAEFAQRFPNGKVPLSASINCTQGLGRIATEHCAMLAAEGSRLSGSVRAGLGRQLLDILAFTLLSEDIAATTQERSVQEARLRSVQRWIEEHLHEPDLSLERIAAANEISLRSLHLLFRHCELSVSEWIWNRRLQISYDRLSQNGTKTVSEVAFGLGFNSSSHFSTMFRRKFGIRPSDVGKV